jgi:hypothetical protein
MLQVGFEPMIPVFKQAKTVHALDRAATVVKAFIKLKFLKRKWFTKQLNPQYSYILDNLLLFAVCFFARPAYFRTLKMNAYVLPKRL